ncbi:cupredoxin domain-containing protein [Streptomyces sp. 8N616]|uniref:cupredoxin domain-containing protein n=1 Tax=Streptomyces sp. 8N616 TaxID=3457414 RepID=UPI003FD60B0D
MDTTDTPGAEPERRPRPPSRSGNRVLLIGGLGAAFSAVLCLALLESATSGAAAGAPAPAAGQQAQPAAQQGEQADYTVDLKGNAYIPAKLTVKVGDTVLWTNYDDVPHTVTTTKGPEKFDSGTLDKGESFSYTFTEPGTYEYYCSVHPDMTASVTVVENDGSGSGGSTGGSTSGGSTGGTSGGSSGGHSGGHSTGGSTGGTGGSSGGGTSSGGSTGGSSSGGTGGSGGGDDDAQCSSVKQVLLPILQHINTAHLERSPGEQVQDALALDQYIKTHTVWVESILNPAVEGGGATADKTLTVLLQHIKTAHLEESPGQQVKDLLNADDYVKLHTVWAEHMLQPTEDYLLDNC